MQNRVKFVISIFALLLFSFSAIAVDSKICSECSIALKDGRMKITRGSLIGDESFDEYYKLYCMRFEQLVNKFDFQKNMLEDMRKSPYPVDRFWLEVNCRPSRIGGTLSPIVHLVAEEVGGRMQFFELLHKYYQQEKSNVTWINIVNTKNTRGHTLLDYIDYLDRARELREEEREDINKLINFLCKRGGTYSYAKNKNCN